MNDQIKQLIAQKTFHFNLSSIVHGLLGLFVLLVVAYAFSSNRKAISWPTVAKGLLVQFIIAVSVLFFKPIQDFFHFFGQCFVTVLAWTRAGSEFVFGQLIDTQQFGFIYAFQIVPTIIFFAAFTSLLFYLGIIQKIVSIFGHLLRKAIKLSGAESLVTIGNIFLGQSESPFLVRPYIARMTRSEIMLLMTAGMATMAGGILATYIQMLGGGIPELELEFAKHLLSASVMAAPGAVVMAKMLVPETHDFVQEAQVSKEQTGRNILEAIANGTMDGLKLAVSVSAILLVFYALIAGLNYLLKQLGGYSIISLTALSCGLGAGFLLKHLLRTSSKPMKAVQWVVSSVLLATLTYTYLGEAPLGGSPLLLACMALCLGLLVGSMTVWKNMVDRRVKQTALRYAPAALMLGLGILLCVLCFQHGMGISLNELIGNSTHQQYSCLTMQYILGQIFSPIMWLIGISSDDVSLAGQLLGQKLILTEFVGYKALSQMLANGSFAESKSIIMSAYVLCGFANFASVGMIIGAVGALAPNQKHVLSSLGMRALLGGTLAALVSATIVGIML